MTIKLITPIAIEKGLKFAIREGGRTVGAGSLYQTSLNNYNFSYKYTNKGPYILYGPFFYYIIKKR